MIRAMRNSRTSVSLLDGAGFANFFEMRPDFAGRDLRRAGRNGEMRRGLMDMPAKESEMISEARAESAVLEAVSDISSVAPVRSM